MNWKIISHLNKAKIKVLEDNKLRAFVKYQIPYHPFYRDLFKKIIFDLVI
jgi:phenylacetate-coenzyme A ligase PaaK-like adenylate-forming protein